MSAVSVVLQALGIGVVVYFAGRVIQVVLVLRALTADARRAKRLRKTGIAGPHPPEHINCRCVIKDGLE